MCPCNFYIKFWRWVCMHKKSIPLWYFYHSLIYSFCYLCHIRNQIIFYALIYLERSNAWKLLLQHYNMSYNMNTLEQFLLMTKNKIPLHILFNIFNMLKLWINTSTERPYHGNIFFSCMYMSVPGILLITQHRV